MRLRLSWYIDNANVLWVVYMPPMSMNPAALQVRLDNGWWAVKDAGPDPGTWLTGDNGKRFRCLPGFHRLALELEREIASYLIHCLEDKQVFDIS